MKTVFTDKYDLYRKVETQALQYHVIFQTLRETQALRLYITYHSKFLVL